MLNLEQLRGLREQRYIEFNATLSLKKTQLRYPFSH